MSDKHNTNCEQGARRESFAAEPTGAADPLVLRRGLKGSWIRAVFRMASRRMARRTMDLAVLLVVGLAASEARAQPGPPPMPGRRWPGRRWAGHRWAGRPGWARDGNAPDGRAVADGRAADGRDDGAPQDRPRDGNGDRGQARARPDPQGRGGGAGLPGQPPAPGFQPRGGAAGRPSQGGRSLAASAVARRTSAGSGPAVAPSRAGPSTPTMPAGITAAGPIPGAARSTNPRHASWYHGGWANSRGGTWDKGRDSAAWDNVRDYVREERVRDYAAGLAWGLGGWASSGYGSGDSSGYGYGTGSSSGYGTDYGSGTGSGVAYANTSSDASSTDSDSSRTDAAQETKSDGQQDGAAADRGYQAFDRARDAFKAGDYAAALDLTDEALKDVPDDPLVHEFKALVLFARGEDARAAAELHDVLAVRPGMDWTTLMRALPGRRDLHRPVAGPGGPLPAGPEGRGAPLRPGLPLPGRRAQRRGRGAAQGGARPGARRPGGPPPPRVADRNPCGAARDDPGRARPRRGRRPTARRWTSSAAGGASATGRRST